MYSIRKPGKRLPFIGILLTAIALLAYSSLSYSAEVLTDYLFDFNDGAQGFVVSGTNSDWEHGTPSSWPGGCAPDSTHCWGTHLAGAYSSESDSILTSPEIDLRGTYGSIAVSWWQIFEIEGTTLETGEIFGDGVFAEMRVQESSGTWGEWFPLWQHTGSYWKEEAWSEMAYDISAFAGKIVAFRFRLASDHEWQYSGYYVDRFSVVAESFFDFEQGNEGFSVSGGEWQRGTPTAWPNQCAHGNECWGTNLSGNYGHNADATLLSSTINLKAPAYYPPLGGWLQVTWQQATHIENVNFDQAYAEVRVDNGEWEEMWAHSGDTAQINWHEKVHYLPENPETVEFRFRIITDDATHFSGYYLDALRIGQRPLHEVTPSAGENGTINPDTMQIAPHDATIDFTITADTGYHIDQPVGGSCGGSFPESVPRSAATISEGTYTTAAVIEECSVEVSFSPNVYTLSFDSAGGSDVAEITQPYQSTITPPADPTKEGYSFTGWDNAIPAAMPLDGGSFTAQWTPNDYTITFDSDDGSEVLSITAAYGSAITRPGDPTRIGYTFADWDPAVPEFMPLNGAALTAQWTINQYTITFESAGGSAVNSITQNYGTAVTAPTNPSKVGHTFTAWDPAVPSTMPADNQILTAQWTINQYTITFDSAEGSAVNPITEDYDTAIIAPEAPTRTGYTFSGWDPKLPATMPAENQTVTAQWQIEQYTITFDSNEGSAVNPITQNFGTTVTAPEAPTREGHSFTGWTPLLPQTMPAVDETHTAQWQINQYTITFDSDGGSEVTPIKQDFGSAITPPENPTRDGYNFTGWDSTVPETMPAEDLTLTAQWGINTYKITFNSNGGSAVETITQKFGSEINVDDPTRRGYTFLGWEPALPATMPNEDMSLTAQWEPTQYTLAFNTNGGSSIDPLQLAAGAEVPVVEAPTREGHTFSGWSPSIPATMPPQNVTVNAQWQVKQYTLFFESAGGTSVDPISQNFGSAITPPREPTREDYLFNGWNPPLPETMPAANATHTALWVSPTCHPDNYAVLPGDVGKTIFSQGVITAALPIASGESLNLRAGTIVLGEGFHAQAGSSVRIIAETVQCAETAPARIAERGVESPETEQNESYATWLPDAQFLSYAQLPTALQQRLAPFGSENGPFHANADGSLILFASEQPLLAGDHNGMSDIYLYAVDSDRLRLVSATAEGFAANGASTQPRIDGLGRFVLFRSEASDLVAGDANGVADIFLYDLYLEQLQRVSYAPGEGDGTVQAANNPALGGDPLQVLYDREVAGVQQVYGVDIATATTALLSPAADRLDPQVAASHPAISSSGRFIAYLESGESVEGSCNILLLDRASEQQARVICPLELLEAEGALLPSFSNGGEIMEWRLEGQEEVIRLLNPLH